MFLKTSTKISLQWARFIFIEYEPPTVLSATNPLIILECVSYCIHNNILGIA